MDGSGKRRFAVLANQREASATIAVEANADPLMAIGAACYSRW